MKKLIPTICMFLLAASMLGTSTFAWFSMNGSATATGLSVTAEAPSSLLISNNGASYSSTTTLSSGTLNGKIQPSMYFVSSDDKYVFYTLTAEFGSSYVEPDGKMIMPVDTIYKKGATDGAAATAISLTNVASSGSPRYELDWDSVKPASTVAEDKAPAYLAFYYKTADTVEKEIDSTSTPSTKVAKVYYAYNATTKKFIQITELDAKTDSPCDTGTEEDADKVELIDDVLTYIKNTATITTYASCQKDGDGKLVVYEYTNLFKRDDQNAFRSNVWVKTEGAAISGATLSVKATFVSTPTQDAYQALKVVLVNIDNDNDETSLYIGNSATLSLGASQDISSGVHYGVYYYMQGEDSDCKNSNLTNDEQFNVILTFSYEKPATTPTPSPTPN